MHAHKNTQRQGSPKHSEHLGIGSGMPLFLATTTIRHFDRAAGIVIDR